MTVVLERPAITSGHLIPCPLCGAGPLAPCTTPAGVPLPYPHLDRLRA